MILYLIWNDIKKKIPAGSIIEITVAVTLLSMVFMFAIMIYLNITKSSGSINKLELSAQIKYLETTTIQNKNYVNEELRFTEYTIRKYVGNYNDSDNLVHLKIEGYSSSGQLIMVYNRVVYETLQ
jgi:hypothetical protein